MPLPHRFFLFTDLYEDINKMEIPSFNKDPVSPDEITCIVHEILCDNSEFVYGGQAKRDLNSRIKKRQRAIKQ